MQKLTIEKSAIIIIDKTYRLKKTIDELNRHFVNRPALLALDLSQENELVLEGSANYILQNLDRDKAEFMLLIYPHDKV